MMYPKEWAYSSSSSLVFLFLSRSSPWPPPVIEDEEEEPEEVGGRSEDPSVGTLSREGKWGSKGEGWRWEKPEVAAEREGRLRRCSRRIWMKELIWWGFEAEGEGERATQHNSSESIK